MKRAVITLILVCMAGLHVGCATIDQPDLACRKPGILVFGSRVPMDSDVYCW